MKTSDSALRSLLHGSRDAAYAELVTVTLADTTVARWTTGVADITYGWNTYTAGGTGTAPVLNLSKVREAIGLEVSTLELTLGCGSTATIGGTDLRQVARAGGFDNARVSVLRAYMATPGGAVVGALTRFSGLATDCEADSNELRLRVQSDIYRLEEMLPRHLIREKCVWALYDAGCGVSEASFTTSATVSTTYVGATTTTFGTSMVYPASAEQRDGRITFTGGALTGISRMVVSTGPVGPPGPYHLGVVVDAPLPSAPAHGDAFDIVAGCDKTYSTCSATFSNTTRRRGFDFVPPPDSVG